MKDVRTKPNVGEARMTFTNAIEEHERGNLRVSTLRDLFRNYLRIVAEERGDATGTLAE